MRTKPITTLLALAACGLAASVAAPAFARTCPSGQFLQVSKGKCIPKESARKLGIAHEAHAARHAKSERPAEAKAETAGETTVARSAPDSGADGNPSSQADARPAETTVASAGGQPSPAFAPMQPDNLTVRRNIAPFGALQFSGFK